MKKHLLLPSRNSGCLQTLLFVLGFLVALFRRHMHLPTKKIFLVSCFLTKNQNQGTLSVPLLAPKSFCTTTMVITTKQMMSWFPMPTWRPVNKAKPWAATALQFTVNPGAYRLKVVTGDPLLGFPSTRFSVQNTQGTGDSYGDVFSGGAVVNHELMDVMTTQKYFLRFELEADSDDVSNNFVPVDLLTERISIQSSASLKSASVGDIVSYATIVQNRANGNITMADGGVELIDELPVGFELVKGSYAVFKVSDANQYTEITGLPEPSGRFLRFGAFELLADSKYEVRYNVQIKANAPLGLQLNKTWLRKVDTQEPLSGLAGVAVMITPDTLLTTSTVLGHVFCDENDNQLQDINEMGIGGVSVYLDNGGHVVTDGSGLFHLSRVSAGMHLAKIDTLTLPPQSVPFDEGRARFYSSSGLPGEVSFPVACGNAWVASDSIDVNEISFAPGVPPRRLRDIQVAGKLSLLN